MLTSRHLRSGTVVFAGAFILAACGGKGTSAPDPETVASGREIFRYDTYGNEKFWTDTLRTTTTGLRHVPTTASVFFC